MEFRIEVENVIGDRCSQQFLVNGTKYSHGLQDVSV